MEYFLDAREDRALTPRTRAALRGAFIALSDGVTHYELTGPPDGDVVVLTGGITVPLFYWDDTVAALHDRGFRTLTYSAYGRGYSDRVRGRYDEDLFVRQLTELIEALAPPGPNHVVGASMGALVAMEYTRRTPTAVRSLALIGPAGVSSRPLTQRLLTISDRVTRVVARRWGRRVFDEHRRRNITDPESAARLQAMIADAYRHEGSLYAFFSTLGHFPLFDRGSLYAAIGSLAIPTVLMWGTDDLVTPIDALDHVRDLLRPDELRVVEDCGHMVPFERPSLVAETIAEFVTPDRKPL
ncbi:alpha/beta fold hydrolase [Williamsia herbipolensis]|uniref:alpha/beta fold hydrolase n=1 Tax=Williamsia herbipolensis TaxID=1603258 RepID=UPI0005F88300|nr:alpha/beta hydrolase [Williamsia herbipolensis]